MLAQVEISRLEQQKIQEIEEMRKRMVQVTNDAALTVLGLKNDLAELERSYNQARAECSKWEKIMANAKNTVANHDLNKDRALDGVHYMYRLLCKRRSKFAGKLFKLLNFGRNYFHVSIISLLTIFCFPLTYHISKFIFK